VIASAIRCGSLAAITLLAGACADAPLLQYSLRVPAVTLHPISQAPVVDGRAPFRELLCRLVADRARWSADERPCEQILHRLSDEPAAVVPGAVPSSRISRPLPVPTVVFVPGLFGECVEGIVTPFSDAYPRLRSLGYRVHVAHVDGRSGSAHNARMLNDALAEIGADEFVVVAYSKGVPDTLEMLAAFSETAAKVRAVVSIAGIVSGTPLADRLAPGYSTLARSLPFPTCPPGDGDGVRSVARETRLDWLAGHRLPESVRYYSLVAFTSADRISNALAPFHALLSRVDPRNDGQVIHSDAVVPGSVLLGYVDGDHWAVALPFREAGAAWREIANHNDFPREVVIESVLQFVEDRL